MIARAFLFLFCLTLSAPAIVDTNENGVSDPWEKQFNSGNLFTTFDAQADPDGDGWPHEQEAVAGTDPFDANSPQGFVRTEIEHIPAVYLSPEEEGGPPVLVSPETVSIRWPTLAGKQYAVLSSPDLTPASWLPVGAPRVGSGSIITAYIPLTQPDSSIPEKLFLRVAVEDTDTDGDTLTDAEENELGSNPYSADGDGDGLTDWDELLVYHTNLSSPDSDGDGVSDGDETNGGTDPNSSASHGPVFKSVNRSLDSDIYVYDATEGFLSFNVSWENPGLSFRQIASRIAFPDLDTTLAEEAPFPETIPEVTEPWLYSNGWAATEPSTSYGNPPPKGRSVAFLRQRRLWLQVAPAATEDIHRKCLKVTTRTSLFGVVIPPVVESIDVTIPAGATESPPLDFLGDFIGDGWQGYNTREVFSQVLLPVEVVDKNGVSLSELKIGKMYPDVLSGNGLSGGPVNVNLDKDEDRFFVRVKASGSLGTIKMKFETVDNAEAMYNDDPTEYTLESKDGYLTTKAMVLVSDDVDDNHLVSTGGAPDNSPDDRTHLIQLGGNFKISAIKFGEGGWMAVDVKLPVKKKKTVRVQFVNCTYGVIDIDPCWDPALIAWVQKKMRQRYAQVGIDFDFPTVLAGPWVSSGGSMDDDEIFSLPSGTGKMVFPQESKDLVDHGPPNDFTNTLMIYLVNGLDSFRGVASPPKYVDAADNRFKNKVLLARYDFKDFTSSHEALHVLSDAAHDVPPYVDFTTEYSNMHTIWTVPPGVEVDRRDNGSIGSNKRISLPQEVKIQSTTLAH